MDIRPITDSYAVSPQIQPADAAALKEAGFVTVICNRPDGEVPPELSAAAVRAAVEAAGMTFVENPLSHGSLTESHIDRQRAAIANAGGKVFAYCASGNRCSILWALAMAGSRPVDELIGLPARYGYQLGGLRPALEARSGAKG